MKFKGVKVWENKFGQTFKRDKRERKRTLKWGESNMGETCIRG